MLEELVYLITKAVMENFDDFKAQHPAFGFLKKENMIKMVYLSITP